MSIFLSIIAFFLIFSALILVHEFGHFWVARKAGIKVEEFGIGFRPRLFSKKVGETVYSINAIPFGGFVRLHGEDSTEAAAMKDKRSFQSKSPLARAAVVLAGVFMNFVLAIFLLTVGFSFGIEPLLVTEQDLFDNLAAGNVTTSPGVFVSKVSDQVKSFGINPGDKILAIDDKPITQAEQIGILEKGKGIKDIDITIESKQGTKKIHLPLVGKDKDYGVDLKSFTDFPRLFVLEVKPGSNSEKAGIKVGDVILQMNSKEVYFQSDFEDALSGAGTIKFSVLRERQIVPITVNLPEPDKVLLADVSDGSAAQKAGFNKRDVVVSIDGVAISTPQQVQEVLKKNPGKEMVYKLIREGKQIEIKAKTGANNVLGVALSAVSSFKNSEISLYRGSVLTSIMEIKKVRYNPFVAFKKAVSESARLTGLTISAFGRMIVTMVSKFTVPAEIGGPVQIAYYTHAFVQEGFFALLRFAAILSLSLGVINVLPIPAVDGGRLLFIVAEVVLRRKINARFEAMVHGIGFILLILMIFAVTYKDIVSLL